MHLSTLADPVQLQRMALLCGTKRPFLDPVVVKDDDGVDWACARIGGHLYALPADRLDGLSFGDLAERLYWLIYYEVREQRVAEIELSRDYLRRRLWGDAANRNWLARLRAVLRSMSMLRVGDWSQESTQPLLDAALPLFDLIEDVDQMRSFVFVIGTGFLGSLEQFAVEGSDGVRYDFASKKKLRDLGKQQRVQDVYLPVYLGDPAALRKLNLSPRQKRLLQAIIRELTFPPRQKGAKKPPERSLDNGEVVRGGLIRSYSGKETMVCPGLDATLNHIGFNGNGVRRGQGYKLATWQDKAGYGEDEGDKLLRDLQVLSSVLGLVVGALGKQNRWWGLGRLRMMACESDRQRELKGLHLRVYAGADWLETWNQLCNWGEAQHHIESAGPKLKTGFEQMERLRDLMAEEKLQQKQVADELGVSKQYLSRCLKKNQCSREMAQRIKTFVIQHKERTPTPKPQDRGLIPPPNFIVRKPRIRVGSSDMRKLALRYHDRGWVVVPAKPETKRPYVRWKKFQTTLPEREQVMEWWTRWPDANIAVVLGPVSDLICVDVDGMEPHRILLELCGGEIPLAPTAKSGNPDPFRYHLFFRHPKDVETGASKTPWNQPCDPHKLELRGHRGIIVLPPSLHKSGNRYAWVNGRSLRRVGLPELPQPLLDGLLTNPDSNTEIDDSQRVSVQVVDVQGLTIAKSTAEFLSGRYAKSEGSRNNRLFKAACDLHARGIPRESAERILRNGLHLKTFEEQREATDTIASAYSEQRAPSRF